MVSSGYRVNEYKCYQNYKCSLCLRRISTVSRKALVLPISSFPPFSLFILEYQFQFCCSNSSTRTLLLFPSVFLNLNVIFSTSTHHNFRILSFSWSRIRVSFWKSPVIWYHLDASSEWFFGSNWSNVVNEIQIWQGIVEYLLWSVLAYAYNIFWTKFSWSVI